jgi:hypothetical protein
MSPGWAARLASVKMENFDAFQKLQNKMDKYDAFLKLTVKMKQISRSDPFS